MPENNLLDLLGVNGSSNQESSSSSKTAARFTLWKENRAVYALFLRILRHGQFNRAGMEGVIIGLDGNYLINYLQLLYPATEIPSLLDDIYLINDGWLTAYRQQQKKT